jgi:hypothetical protein
MVYRLPGFDAIAERTGTPRADERQ